jgi:hypothetical protein
MLPKKSAFDILMNKTNKINKEDTNNSNNNNNNKGQARKERLNSVKNQSELNRSGSENDIICINDSSACDTPPRTKQKPSMFNVKKSDSFHDLYHTVTNFDSSFLTHVKQFTSERKILNLIKTVPNFN